MAHLVPGALGLRTFHKRYTVKDIRRGIACLRRLGLAFDYGFMLLDPDSTLESVAESAAFLGELGASGDVPVHFTKMYPYVGTPIAARLAREGRLTGTLGAPDYPFRDPRLELLQEFLAEGFHERNFGPTGMVSIARLASFDLELLRRFGDGRGAARYAQAIRRLSAEANAIAVSGVQRAVAVLAERSLGQCWEAWPYLQELGQVAHRADQALAAELRAVMVANGYEPLPPRPCEARSSHAGDLASAPSRRQSATNGSTRRGVAKHSSAAARKPPAHRSARPWRRRSPRTRDK